jgi:hypothetical protein
MVKIKFSRDVCYLMWIGISLSLPIATSAAFLPDSNMEPNVGPILGKPCVSVTDMPVAINPGNTSPV